MIARRAAKAMPKAKLKMAREPGRGRWRSWHVNFKEGEEALAIHALEQRMRRIKPRQYLKRPAISSNALVAVEKVGNVCVRAASQYSPSRDQFLFRLDVMVRGTE